jgi:hypothetical protein
MIASLNDFIHVLLHICQPGFSLKDAATFLEISAVANLALSHEKFASYFNPDFSPSKRIAELQKSQALQHGDDQQEGGEDIGKRIMGRAKKASEKFTHVERPLFLLSGIYCIGLIILMTFEQYLMPERIGFRLLLMDLVIVGSILFIIIRSKGLKEKNVNLFVWVMVITIVLVVAFPLSALLFNEECTKFCGCPNGLAGYPVFMYVASLCTCAGMIIFHYTHRFWIYIKFSSFNKAMMDDGDD